MVQDIVVGDQEKSDFLLASALHLRNSSFLPWKIIFEFASMAISR
jgi:hypothetical protein